MMFEWSGGDAAVLPAALAIIILCAIAFGMLLHKNSKLKKLPLKFLAVLIVCLEISKQIYYNFFEPFTYYILPLHFCSTFIVLIPLAQFTRGKFNKAVKPLPFCYSLLVIVLMYAYPRTLLGNSTADVFGSFHNLHTIMFHHVIVAYFVFSVALGDYTPGKFDALPLIGGIALYAAYAIPAAYLLGVNYVNILYSQFPPLESLRLAKGQAVYNIALFSIASAAVTIIWLLSYLVASCLAKHKRKVT